MKRTMFEAHVRYELDRWRESLGTEVVAAFGWLGTVRVGDVLTDEVVLGWIDAWPGVDTDGVAEIHEAALADQTPVRELIRREDFDRLAQSVIALRDLQEAVVEQITTSDVYAELITHVLYHGIKNYVVTESPVAKVPGASAFMKFGQSAMDRGAPGLSKGIDRQLMSFVTANISDSLRESRTYLTSVVDEQVLGQVVGEVWNSNADVTVAELAALIPTQTVVEVAQIAMDAWAHLRAADAFREQVTRWLDENAERSVADVLADVGVTVDQVQAVMEPWVERAASDGYLESRIRARLEPFYRQFG